MKVTSIYSGIVTRRDQGSFPHVGISIEPENDLERAILRMARSGTRTVYIYDSGIAEISIQMPRGK